MADTTSDPGSQALEGRLAEIRAMRRAPLIAGFCVLMLGGVAALFQHTLARAVFWLLFPAACVTIIVAALVGLTTSCPKCGKAFFLKLFVEANPFRSRCIHCGLSLHVPKRQ